MNEKFEEHVLSSATLCSSIVWISDIAYWLIRKGFPTDFQSLLIINGISFFLLFSGWFIIRTFPATRNNFPGGALAWPVYFLIFFCLCGFLFGDNITYAAYIFAAIGFGLFAYALFVFISKIDRQRLAIIGISIFLGAWAVCKVWGSFSLHPLFSEALAFLTEKELPYVHDTLFHASFAQMFKTYNIPSTGLDGLPLMYYHYGSHWLMGHLSSFIGVNVLTIYNVGYPIIFVPIFFYTFISLSIELQRFFCGRILTNGFFWLLILCFFLPIPNGVYSLGLLGISLLVNESQTISMIFLFFLFSICLNYESIFKENKILFGLIVTITVMAIGFIKISTAFVIVPFLGYLYLKYRGYKHVALTVSMILSIAGFLFVYFFTVETIPFLRSSGHEGTFEFFHFYRKTHGFNSIDWFAWFYFWAYAAILLNVIYRKRIPVQDNSSRWLILEAIVITALVGAFPSMVLVFSGGNSMYFSNIQLYISGLCFLGLFPLIFEDIQYYISSKSYKTFVKYGLGIVVVVILILCFREIRSNLKNMIAKSIQIRFVGSGRNYTGSRGVSALYSGIKESYNFNVSEFLKSSPSYQYITNLSSLDSIPLSEKKNMVLYKPCDCQDDIKWSHNCLTKSHLTPALSGLVSIHGIPDKCFIGVFGAIYYPDFYSSPERKFSLNEVKARAQTLGFKKILFYDCNQRKFRNDPPDCLVTR